MLTTVTARYQVAIALSLAVGVSLVAGVLVGGSPTGLPRSLLGVIALAWLSLLLSLSPASLFVVWFALAPIFADSTQDSAIGRAGVWAAYIVPSLLLGLLTLVRVRRRAVLSLVDLMPAAFVVYVLLSIVASSSAFADDPRGTARIFYLMVVVGPVAYYFLTVGPGVDIPRRTVVAIIMLGAALQGGMAMVDASTHWNLWGFSAWQGASGARAVSTLGNPAVLGAFIGAGAALAVAALIWPAPRSIRRLAMVTLAFGVPGLLATFTRGPVLATTIVITGLLLLGRKRVLGLAIIGTVFVGLIVAWPTIRNTDVVEQRVLQANTVQARVGLQEWSLELAAQKPVLGWGYGSFDTIKYTSELQSVEGIPTAYLLGTTSHNTYLTFLVELGTLGGFLYLIPFLIVGYRASRHARSSPEAWLVVGTIAAMLIVFLTATTLDLRFFSFAQALPWILLAILRSEYLRPSSYRAP